MNPEANNAPLQVLVTVLGVLGLVLFVRHLAPQRVRGQDASPRTLEDAASTPVTLLAAIALVESDWSSTDRASQWWVLRRRAQRAGITVEQEARLYVAGLRVGVSDRTRWKLHITPDCTEPPGWQVQVEGAWSLYVRRCTRLFEDAERFNQGVLVDPCRGADQWGSRKLPQDVARALRALSEGRWVRADCAGRTANAYYREVR